MSILKPVSILFVVFILFSCVSKNKNKDILIPLSSNKIELTRSQNIINQTIVAHGGDLYSSAHYSFVFRNNTYEFKNDGNKYEYTRISGKGELTIKDVLKNGDLKRIIDGKLVKLSDREEPGIKGGINSVIYFATLPSKLSDKAVNSKYIESVIIKDKKYDVLEITFNKRGGGNDHDDEYYYWINKDTKKTDYLAYNYTVNKGGVRFRSSYNSRVVNGVTFQDYVNYEAAVGTPLKNLPALYEAEKLKELSRIKTENILDLSEK